MATAFSHGGSSATGRAAVASTMKDVGPRIDSWVRWHRHLGFARIYIFFDASDEVESANIAKAAGGEAVVKVFMRDDPSLLDGWRRQASWKALQADVDRDVQIRQLLSAQFAMELAKSEGLEWLLHIDSDELFLPQPMGATANAATEHFARLAAAGCECFIYHNHEAVPETRTLPGDADPFQALSLFKLSASRVARGMSSDDAATEGAIESWRSRNLAKTYFLYYENGKCACRVDTDGLWVPVSVHQCLPRRPSQEETSIWDRERLKSAGWTNDARNSGLRHELDEQTAILHFPVWSPDALWRKYNLHGAFPDSLPSGATHKGGLGWGDCFHTQCRDVYLAHRHEDDSGLGAMRRLFESSVMPPTAGPWDADRQQRIGLLKRFSEVRSVLRPPHPPPPPSTEHELVLMWTAGQQKWIEPWQDDADYAVERLDWRGPKRAAVALT